MELLIFGILWYFLIFTIFSFFFYFLIVKILYNFAKEVNVLVNKEMSNKFSKF